MKTITQPPQKQLNAEQAINKKIAEIKPFLKNTDFSKLPNNGTKI